MKIVQRRRYILETLQRQDSADISDLARALDVSTMTIRRDLKALESNGSVTITQGSAVLNDGALQEYNMLFKRDINVSEKRRIAHRCLDYISDGDVVFLDAGTTVKELALLLMRRKNINIMTHSFLAANVLTKQCESRLVMCPGEFREMSMAFMGPLTDDFVGQFQIDILFLSVEGVSRTSGVSVVDIADGHSKKVLIERARRVVLMADSSKFDKSLFYAIAPLSQIDVIVTDEGLSDELFDEYCQEGCCIERV